jgi:CSLREA domain-containing protein
MRHRRLWGAGRPLIVSALTFALALQLAPPAYAALIVVTTTVDELNNDGDCSLREAIRAANADAAVDTCVAGSGADVITLPAGTYTLTIAGEETAASAGDLDITDDLSISGAGADGIVSQLWMQPGCARRRWRGARSGLGR